MCRNRVTITNQKEKRFLRIYSGKKTMQIVFLDDETKKFSVKDFISFNGKNTNQTNSFIEKKN